MKFDSYVVLFPCACGRDLVMVSRFPFKKGVILGHNGDGPFLSFGGGCAWDSRDAVNGLRVVLEKMAPYFLQCLPDEGEPFVITAGWIELEL